MESATEQLAPRPADRTQTLLSELGACWRQLPDKGLFLGLLAGWLAFFQFLGNSTFGYIPTASLHAWMLNAYNSPGTDDGHGLLIPVVVAVLFYLKRRTLLGVQFRAWWPALMILAAACLLHTLGYVVQQPRLSVMALFLGLYGLMGLVWGPQWLRACFFPFFLLGFCVPLGSLAESVSFPLRILVSQIVALLGQGLGINVAREGTQLINPDGRFQYEVAAACSGIRSLIATVAIATIYAFTAFRAPWKRVLILGSALPLAVVGNVFRMLLIVLAGQWLGQKAGGYVHESAFWGLLPYVPAILGMLLLGRWFGEDDLRPGQTRPTTQP